MLAPGQSLPDVSMPVIRGSNVATESIRKLTAGRKTALFAVPGAFTPVCSDDHLPGYISAAQDFADHGIAQIFCLSVNDRFVLARWAEATGAGDTIAFLADGNCEFTRAAGMTLDGSGHHLGERSQRYAMIVDDGRVVHIHVEKDTGLGVSSASNLLKNL